MRKLAALAIALLVFSAGNLIAEESKLKNLDKQHLPEDQQPPYYDNVVLPFWEIGLSDFKAETPRPIAVPNKYGDTKYYWYWLFTMKAVTNLDKAKDAIRKELPKLGVDAREHLEQHLSRIEKTLEIIYDDKDEKNRRLDRMKAARAYMSLHTDTAQIIPESADPSIRNLIERKVKRRLYTTEEIAELKLKKGQVINGVAIFPSLDPNARNFEIRVCGLGKRYVPHYRPQKLLFFQNSFDASLKRALRFQYRRHGSNSIRSLDPITFIGARSDWVWIWPSHIFAGRWRQIKIKRDLDLPENNVILEREYRYIPYKIWNNTSRKQNLDILKAGVRFSVSWMGEDLTVYMPDVGEPSRFWKVQIWRAMRESIDSGKEQEFVKEHEMPGKDIAGAEIEADVEAKSDIFPKGAVRHPKGELAPAQVVKGLMIVRWGPDNLDEIVDMLVANIRSKAIVPAEDGEKSELLKGYLALQAEIAKAKPGRKYIPSPDKEDVIAMIVKKAGEDLAANHAGVSVSEDDKRRWKNLAPLGRLLTELATDYAQKRADGGNVAWKNRDESGGVVDIFFEVLLDGVIDRCSFASNFKRRLPSYKQDGDIVIGVRPYKVVKEDIGAKRRKSTGD